MRDREGLFAGRAAQDDRARARSAAAAIGGSLDREAAARDAAVRHHTGEVEQQRARDAVEVPGLSPAALARLKAVQMARLTAEIPREGERYDARQRRKEELVSADEYQRLKRRDRQVLTLSDFTDADIAALEATRAPESSKAFDHELQQ